MHLLDSGGHIYDMAWAPQAEADSTCSSSPDAEWLAIARAPDRTTRSLVDAPLPGGSIQIWKFPLHQSTPTLHVVLESEGGTPLRLAWQPKQTGGLGVLAATYADGSVRMMRVPDEEAPTSIAADDVRILRLASACFSLDWQGDRLAVGCVNGDVAVWDVASDLPLVHAPVHDTLVSAVQWQALPPVTMDGIPDAAQQPTTLLSLGWDGTELVSDVHAMYTPVRLAHTRGTCFSPHPEPRYAAAWAPYGGLFAVDLGDNHFGSVSLRTHDVGQHHALGFHHGRITALAASSCHPYVASGATDGSVKFTNVLGAGKRKTEDGSRVRRPTDPGHAQEFPPLVQRRALRPRGHVLPRRRLAPDRVQDRAAVLARVGRVGGDHRAGVQPQSRARAAARERHGARHGPHRVDLIYTTYPSAAPPAPPTPPHGSAASVAAAARRTCAGPARGA